jgi:anti-anti-sigma factor
LFTTHRSSGGKIVDALVASALGVDKGFLSLGTTEIIWVFCPAVRHFDSYEKADMTSYLNCPRCGLSVTQQADRLSWSECPRCRGRHGIAVPMHITDRRRWPNLDPDPADGLFAAHPEPLDGAQLSIGRRPCADGWVLTLHGELDLASVAVLQDALGDITRIGFVRLVLDLRDVSFMDSTGLAVIVAADLRARRNDTRLILVCRGQVKRLLRLTGVDHHLNLSPSVALHPPIPDRRGQPRNPSSQTRRPRLTGLRSRDT